MINKRGTSRFAFLFNRRLLNSKRSQVFGLSFSVMFSILLIIFFIVVAGIAINHFLDLKKCTQIGLFIKDLQTDVDKAWSSQSSGFEFSGSLPSGLQYVCFANLSNSISSENPENIVYSEISIYQHAEANLFFYPRKKSCDMPYHNIEHIDVNAITELKNPYCIEVDGGKIVIDIDKGFGEALVGLS